MSGSGDYISREAVKQIIAAQCGECADACLEFDGIQPDCNQCLLNGAKKAIESIPAADVRSEVKSKWADNCVSFYRGCPECGAFARANLDEVFLRDFPSAVGKLISALTADARWRKADGT